MVEFVIGPYRFASKSLAAERVKAVLHSTVLGTYLQGEDFTLIRWLLNKHSEVDEKVGSGVLALSVNKNTMGSRGFWIHRVDGSVVDFSYRHALNGKPNHRQEVLTAMRWEVDSQIVAFRDRYFSRYANENGQVLCPLTGLWVTRSEAHVDHVVRFVDLADHFINWFGGYDRVEYEYAEIGARGWLKDRQLGTMWQNWHGTYAQLRVVERKANLARNRKESVRAVQ